MSLAFHCWRPCWFCRARPSSTFSLDLVCFWCCFIAPRKAATVADVVKRVWLLHCILEMSVLSKWISAFFLWWWTYALMDLRLSFMDLILNSSFDELVQPLEFTDWVVMIFLNIIFGLFWFFVCHLFFISFE